jgi:hypothetical protein
MTLRRWMWMFVAIGLACLALSALGQWVLPWPPRMVRMWAGIGGGYLMGALLFSLMPRWWRQHCDESYAQPAGRRYVRALWPIMIGYCLLLFASVWLIRLGIEPLALKALVALLPVLPLALLLRVALRYLREVDELQRRIETESISIASLLLSLLYFAAGLLQLAKVVAIDGGVAMMWVFPLLMLSYGIAKFFAVRRYR